MPCVKGKRGDLRKPQRGSNLTTSLVSGFRRNDEAESKKLFRHAYAARLAGVFISEMMDILSEYGIKSNLDMEDYRASLKNLEGVY